MEAEGDVFYLGYENVLDIYSEVFECTVAVAEAQLRDPGGLQAALARPQRHADFGHADLAMQAAVLAHGIAEGQYFIDGNKRTAQVACLTFLRLNGYRLTVSSEQVADWILALSLRPGHERLTEEGLAHHLRAALDPPL